MKNVHPINSRRRISRKCIIIIAIVLIGIVAICLFFVGMSKKQQADLNNVAYVKSSVSKLYLLPENEQPALATVTNSLKLTSSLAGKVENGDKILIYQNNKEAIVYRPSINRVIDVQPVVIDDVNSLNTTK